MRLLSLWGYSVSAASSTHLTNWFRLKIGKCIPEKYERRLKCPEINGPIKEWWSETFAVQSFTGWHLTQTAPASLVANKLSSWRAPGNGPAWSLTHFPGRWSLVDWAAHLSALIRVQVRGSRSRTGVQTFKSPGINQLRRGGFGALAPSAGQSNISPIPAMGSEPVWLFLLAKSWKYSRPIETAGSQIWIIFNHKESWYTSRVMRALQPRKNVCELEHSRRKGTRSSLLWL